MSLIPICWYYALSPSSSARNCGAHDLGLAVFLQQRKQAFAHQNAGTVRRHVHLDLAGDVDRRVRVGRFQNVAVLLDDGGVPVDQFLGRAVLLAIVAEKDLNELDTAVIDRSGRIEDDVPQSRWI